MFRVTEYMNDYVQVEVTKTIRIGGQYRISASWGYAGVEEGIVEVVGILSAYDAINIEDKDISNMIEEFKRISVDNLEGTDKDTEQERMDTTIWVVYKNIVTKHEIGEQYVFPLEEFVDHTSQQ